MKSYETATLVELGNAADLVLGLEGQPCDSTPFNNRQFPETCGALDE